MKHFNTDQQAIEWVENLLQSMEWGEKDREAMKRVKDIAELGKDIIKIIFEKEVSK